jgi:hypothetical protein
MARSFPILNRTSGVRSRNVRTRSPTRHDLLVTSMPRRFCELLQAPAPSLRGQIRGALAREKCPASAKLEFAITADKIALACRFLVTERLLCLPAYADCLFYALDTPI